LVAETVVVTEEVLSVVLASFSALAMFAESVYEPTEGRVTVTVLEPEAPAVRDPRSQVATPPTMVHVPEQVGLVAPVGRVSFN
jgi:hypothetical protein